MKKIIYLAITIVVIVGLIFVISTNNQGGNLSDNSKSIKIGAMISLTGVAADFGDMSKKAMDLAVEEINQNGGVDGRKAELYIEDDQTTPQGSVSAYQKLVGIQNADAVIGGIFDFTAQPIFALAQKDKKVFISPVNFQIDGSFEMNDYSFVLYPKFEQVISQLDSVIADNKINNLAMIRYKSGFGESIENTLANIMKDKGTFNVEAYTSIGSSDFRTNILKLIDKKPTAVFLDMLDFDIVKYIDVAEGLGFKPQLIAYTTMREVFNNQKVDKRKLEGSIMIDWEVPSDEFVKRFEKKYGQKPRRGANKSYDAIYILAESIAKSKTAEDVPKYIESNTFKTVNGETSFTAKHSAKDTPINIYKIKSGDMVVVKEVR
jgi:branched-chain amino acid transport system substrate-binding protein